MSKFLLQLQGAVLKEIPITTGVITIGRAPDNDIVIDNPAVSSHHCKVTLVGNTFVVEDLNSSNGVFLNAKKTVKANLQHNDVIGIVKHALKFIDEGPQPAAEQAPAAPVSADATMMMSPQKRQELAVATATAAQKPAMVHIVKGIVDRKEHELTAASTYIGKSDRAQIRIKGKGFFRWAPASAAMIARRLEGYFLLPVAKGYAKLNGQVVAQKEQLKDGDMIEVGGTTMVFELPSTDQ